MPEPPESPSIANQARPRIAAAPQAETNAGSEGIAGSSPYLGLGINDKSLRLIHIEPAGKDDPLVCRLEVVAYGTRPSFEALSYVWGSEADEQAITLNGIRFKVRRNLFDALRFLRSHRPSKVYLWIDALCIDQTDYDERNSQVRIMNQIYRRAASVLVWLGTKSAEFQTKIKQSLNKAPFIEAHTVELTVVHPEKDPAPEDTRQLELDIVRELATDEYWGRVWILQEIGRAKPQHLKVCFGDYVVPWTHFICLVGLSNSPGSTQANQGPLRLHGPLIVERYGKSHTLISLLETYRDSKCTNPRDKVYGLLGLAIDASGLSVDYRKSTFEVWTDTMTFLNREWRFADYYSKDKPQTLVIGQLLKDMLLGPNPRPLDVLMGLSNGAHKVDRTEVEELLVDRKNKDARVFELEALYLGSVIHIGPTTTQFVEFPSAVAEWEAQIEARFSQEAQCNAQREQENLFNAIMDLEDFQRGRMCFIQSSTVVWTSDIAESGNGNPRHAGRQKECGNGPMAQDQQQAHVNGDGLADPRLILMKTLRKTYHASEYPDAMRKLGIASSLVTLGDHVCWVRFSRRALLVRELGNRKCQIVGTALTTEDISGLGQPWSEPQKDDNPWNPLGRTPLVFPIQLDSRTIFSLLM